MDDSTRALMLAPATGQELPLPDEAPLSLRLKYVLVRWSFLVFVFSIPFESMDLLGVADTFSLAKLFALQFLLMALLCAEWTFARPHRSFWYFLAYLCVFALFAIPWISLYAADLLARLLTLVQLLLLFWVGVNALADEQTYAKALTALGLSCVLVVILRLTGVALGGMQYGEFVRVSAFNQNPNGYALTLAFGALALLGRTRLTHSPMRLPARCLCWGLSLLLMSEILATGARGAAVALLAGLLILYGAEGPSWLRIAKGALLIFALGVVFFGPFGSDTSRSRWEETFSEGDVAHRDVIYAAAAAMGLERPLLGWGPVAHLYELGRRVRYPEGYRDTHNDFFWVWNEVGLVGLVPFLAGILLWIKGAWGARRGPWGTVPLAFLTAILTMSLSGTLHYTKLFWLAGMFAVVGGAAPALRPAPEEPEPVMESPGETL